MSTCNLLVDLLYSSECISFGCSSRLPARLYLHVQVQVISLLASESKFDTALAAFTAPRIEASNELFPALTDGVAAVVTACVELGDPLVFDSQEQSAGSTG